MAGKQVLVIGLARSGMAGSLLLAAEGAQITINDKRDLHQLNAEEKAFLQANSAIRFIGGGHPADLVEPKTALVVKNPGVPLNLPPLKRAMELGIPIITEVELAARKIKGPIVAITGTNGKTTTTALTGEMYQAGGLKTFVAGNIGLPLSAVTNQLTEDTVVVAELSSFQLESTINFSPRLAAILNITPDHLDYHGTFEAYRAAKAKIFANQSENDAVILNADDPETYNLRHLPVCRIYFFSRKKVVERGAYVRDSMIVLRDNGCDYAVCPVEKVAIPGVHNLENALAAALLAWLGGVSIEKIAHVLQTFAGVPHRLEHVRTLNGIDYINDSKGTNVDATLKALAAFKQRKILIAGGYEKGADFTPLVQALHDYNVGHVIVMGQVAQRLSAAMEAAGYQEYTFAKSLEEAVKLAAARAQQGEVVLLSPACASWGMFKNYEQRGELFKKAVWALGGQENGREIAGKNS